jgi:hypothetical protein
MDTIFSTSDVDPKCRFDYWLDIAARKLLKHDGKQLGQGLFRAELKCGLVGEIELGMFDTSALQITREARHVADADIDHVLLYRHITGRSFLEQGGRTAMLESGDMVLIESQLPFSGAYLDASRGMVVKLPRRVFVDHVGDPGELVARRIRRTPGSAALLSGLLSILPNHASALKPPTSEMTIDYLLSLFAQVVGR